MDKIDWKKVEEEYDEIINWSYMEKKKRQEKLKAQGKRPKGLDNDRILYKDINDERNRRIDIMKQNFGITDEILKSMQGGNE